MGIKQPDDERVPPPPAPAFGDSIGAMTIAGGIMGALFHRERTGEATTVDVSLLGVGLWSMGAASPCRSSSTDPWAPPPHGQPTRQPPRRAPTDAKDGTLRVVLVPAGGPLLARALRS